MLPLHHQRDIYWAVLLHAQAAYQPVGVSSFINSLRLYFFIHIYLPASYYLLTLLVFYFSEYPNHLCCYISLTRISHRTPRLSVSSSLVGESMLSFSLLLNNERHRLNAKRLGTFMVISGGFEPTIAAVKGQ